MTDTAPVGSNAPEEIRFQKPHKPNLSGSTKAYRPASYFFQKHYRPVESKIDTLGADFLNEELSKQQGLSKKDKQ